VSLLRALLAGCFFAAHPIHCDVVVPGHGRAELMGASFYLLAILSYVL
jgi:hypothetical protein